ncbi:hypothetical protein DVH24_041670 [Malus domestica]|uniref:Uncharacterized protein n=1 Tax=Malus domestica TaxID=3750 RepID=A0A498ISM0_MALDO|nr:hypothetical protein DVH24_041670 [Malus domestica]
MPLSSSTFISCFGDLLDSIIVDVASDCHQIAKLGLDRNSEEEEEELRLSAQTRVRVADPSNSGEANNKYVGRKAHLKVIRSSTAAQTHNSRGNPASTYSTYSSSNSTSWLSNGASGVSGEEYSNGALEEP